MGPRVGGYRSGLGTFRLVRGSERKRGSGGLRVARRKRSTGRERWRPRPRRRLLRAGRARAERFYTVHVAFTPAPAHRAANTLYADPARSGPVATLIYRIYMP